ncbi:FG-GAP-like repeat-containing protein [Pontimicrobium sp. IMCC45349]|uniref:FG-GAP-like repeat-containing protein n=1 Tax=Pontimicrobium sp. IMCC45349 TaxID=3391574 RepID=UPI00399F3807
MNINRLYGLILIVFLQSNTLTGQISFLDKSINLGLNVSAGSSYLGNGISFCDYDGDGWDDITLTTDDTQGVRFFKNINGTSYVEQFYNISNLLSQTKQVNWVDIDNDGDKDLFVTSDTVGNKLFLNTGNFVFQDITIVSGMDVSNTFSFGASWGDYNNDGFLDVFVSNRSQTIANVLYRNNGDNTFTNVNVLAGISTLGHMAFCSAFFDFNNDGFQDIYVSTDKYGYENLLYKNNGNGTFTDVSVSSGTNINIDAMSVTIDDFNNDGFQDIYITNSQLGNVLFKNNGDETFTDIASSSGTTFNSIGWGAVFLDADLDTDLDLYVSSEFDGSIPIFLSAAFYESNGDETFNLSNSSFNNDEASSFSNAVGDVNNDGKLDIVVTNNFNENIYLWQNFTTTTNNYLKVNLEGVQSNKDGIGSIIEISINGVKQYRYTHCGEGYLSQNSSSEIFGLGTNTTIDYVKVTWLSGIQDVFFNVASNQTLNIVEGSSTLSMPSFINKSFVELYPNPVKDLLNVKSKYLIEQLNIYNIMGKKVLEKNNTNIVDLGELSSGVYIIKVRTSVSTSTHRFVKK